MDAGEAKAVDTLLPRLRDGLARLSLELPPKAEAQLLAYIRLVAHWNKAYNLTAVRKPDVMLGAHIFDSLSILTPLRQHAWDAQYLLDAGCGAGLPGVPLAIASPALLVNLVDSRAKKIAFARQVKTELGLTNTQAVAARLEAWHPPAPFEVIASRALASLTDMVQATRHLLAPGGCWFAMKGRYPRDELNSLPEDVAVRTCLELSVPEVVGVRHLLILEKRH